MKLLKHIVDNKIDYVSNTLNPTYADGFDCEVFKFSALKKAYENASLESEKEHVTPYIWKNSSFYGRDLFKAYSYENSI